MKLDDPAERRSPLWWAFASAALVAVIAAGWVTVSALTRPDSSAPDDFSAGPSSGDTGAPGFAAQPVFDSYDRVAYIPLNAPHGVVLSETTSSAARPATQKPDGVLLQKINDDMVLPFSTSDGPTGFTPTGVATGFSHTPQGAALAAIHYGCWIMKPSGRLDRIKALIGQGVVDDDDVLRKFVANPRTGFDMDYECTPGQLKVDYDPVLSKVRFGYGATLRDGTPTNFESVIIVEWRDDHWVLNFHGYGTDPGGHYGPALVFDPAQGWVPWFAS